jgi:hypothetical protein
MSIRNNRSVIATAASCDQMETHGQSSKTLAGRAAAMKHWRDFAEEVNIPCEGFGDSEEQISMAQFIENNQLVLSFASYMSEKTKNGDPYKSNTVLQYIKHQFYTANNGATNTRCADFFQGYIFSGVNDHFTKHHWYRKMMHQVERRCGQISINSGESVYLNY